MRHQHAGSAFDVTETTQPMPPETRSWSNMAAILCRFSNFQLVIDSRVFIQIQKFLQGNTQSNLNYFLRFKKKRGLEAL